MVEDKTKSKKYFLSYLLASLESDGDDLKKVCDSLHRSRQNLAYWLRKLKELRLIEKKQSYPYSIYSLTPLGKRIKENLGQPQGTMQPLWRCHALIVGYEIKAFGERNAEYVKLIPEARFKEQGIDVEVGQYVTLNRLRGKVMSIDGGRVNVDFNHPLAGKVLAYELTVVSRIDDSAEQVQALIYYFVGLDKEAVSVAMKGNEVEIEFKKKQDIHAEVKGTVAANALKYVSGLERVKFVDIFEKSEKKPV